MLSTATVFSGHVVKVCPERGFGFIKSPTLSKTVFFHASHGVQNERQLPEVGDPIVFFAEEDDLGRLRTWLWAAKAVLCEEHDELCELMGADCRLEEADLLKYSGSLHLEAPLAKHRPEPTYRCTRPLVS